MSQSPGPAVPARAATFAMPPRLRHHVAQRQRFGTPQQMPCPVCGASVLFGPRVRMLDCPSCAAPLVRGSDDDTPIAPTGVLPFVIQEGAVPALAAEGVKTFRLPRPSGARLTSFERVYVPMWRFSTHVVCNWVQEYKDSAPGYPSRETGEFADDYALQVAASTEPHGELLQSLEDVPLSNAQPFPAARIAGVRILPVDVPVQDGWVKARTHFEDLARAGSARDGYSVWPHWSREEGALVLVPAYLGLETTGAVSVPVVVDGVAGKVYGGIGNGPFAPPAGPMPAAMKAVLFVLAVSAAWGAYMVADWLDITLLDVLEMLNAILS